MFSYVAQVIHIFAATVQNVFLLASFTGEVIISTLLWIFNLIAGMMDAVSSFFHVVYEDNICMFTEVPNSVNDIVDSTISQFGNVHNGVEAVFYYIYFKLHTFVASITWIINAVYVVVSEICILLMNTVILMGNTTWLIITFIPVHLPQVVKSSTKYLTSLLVNVSVDAYLRLLKFTNYLTEVPLESFLGITSAVIIVRLCVHFKEIILTNIYNFYWSVVRSLLYLYHACYNYWANPELQEIARMPSGDVMSARDVPYEDADDANAAADALCVICQERQKCVLTLPCRHICLCTECCRRLYSYQRTCPICRTFIYHSVTVYW